MPIYILQKFDSSFDLIFPSQWFIQPTAITRLLFSKFSLKIGFYSPQELIFWRYIFFVVWLLILKSSYIICLGGVIFEGHHQRWRYYKSLKIGCRNNDQDLQRPWLEKLKVNQSSTVKVVKKITKSYQCNRNKQEVNLEESILKYLRIEAYR